MRSPEKEKNRIPAGEFDFVTGRSMSGHRAGGLMADRHTRQGAHVRRDNRSRHSQALR